MNTSGTNIPVRYPNFCCKKFSQSISVEDHQRQMMLTQFQLFQGRFEIINSACSLQRLSQPNISSLDSSHIFPILSRDAMHRNRNSVEEEFSRNKLGLAHFRQQKAHSMEVVTLSFSHLALVHFKYLICIFKYFSISVLEKIKTIKKRLLISSQLGFAF